MTITEETQMLVNVGRQMFGPNVEFHPSVLELIRQIYRERMSDVALTGQIIEFRRMEAAE